MLEEEYRFECPYCSVEMSISIDYAGGRKQKFVYDCQNCCRPIEILIELSQDGVGSFIAQKESD